tara:strand:- start:477 stop:719 length:243 start_codon:yes stop_codon:yes gene_type:complete
MAESAQQEEEKSYTHGPIVVLSDNSTYDGSNLNKLVYLTEKGKDQLDESYDFKHVDQDEYGFVFIDELIEAYNQVHGTNL